MELIELIKMIQETLHTQPKNQYTETRFKDPTTLFVQINNTSSSSKFQRLRNALNHLPPSSLCRLNHRQIFFYFLLPIYYYEFHY